MDNQHTLSPSNADGVVSPLTGNGETCTTLSASGYHSPETLCPSDMERTRCFVRAGRRRPGPRHVLVDFGRIVRRLFIRGVEAPSGDWRQSIDAAGGCVLSRIDHTCIIETTRSAILLNANVFVASTRLRNTDETPVTVTFSVEWRIGEPDATVTSSPCPQGVDFAWRLDDEVGDTRLLSVASGSRGTPTTCLQGAGAVITHTLDLPAAGEATVVTMLQFSDRGAFEFPIGWDDLDALLDGHRRAWTAFWERSMVVTGERTVDRFREMGLYTLRCQATPWSIPPALAEPYWGGGAFHDEMYPFLGLMSANHSELASRMPYFRLATLPRALIRGRGRGALYPWSSTEDGEERDPNGLWLTERFHLGQFAVCIHSLYLYERDRLALEDLWPVLKEIARYYENEVIEVRPDGALRTRRCVDFDESVGPVTNGPFTVCAAIYALQAAAHAGEVLGLSSRSAHWRALSDALRQAIPTNPDGTYAIPDGRALHYSILGPTFPFDLDRGAAARLTAEMIHEACRSDRGWKPGYSDVFAGSNWMWTAGHLGIVHAMLGDSERAWEAIRSGPSSAGPLLSPNEHLDRDGAVKVPWFTTGVGGWLHALHSLFVQVDAEGTLLLPAVPSATPNLRFSGLRGTCGVVFAAEYHSGELLLLTAEAPAAAGDRPSLPIRVLRAGLRGAAVAGDMTPDDPLYARVAPPPWGAGPHSLLR